MPAVGVLAVLLNMLRNALYGSSRPRERADRKPWRRPASHVRTIYPVGKRNMHDPKDQLFAVSIASFYKTPLMNGAKDRVFMMLKEIVAELQTDDLIMSQPSMGEVIRPKE
jgi:hypothetical protein